MFIQIIIKKMSKSFVFFLAGLFIYIQSLSRASPKVQF